MTEVLLIAALSAGILSTVATILMGIWAIYRVGAAEIAARERYEQTMSELREATSGLGKAFLEAVQDPELAQALGQQIAGAFFESVTARGNGAIGGHVAAGTQDILPEKLRPFMGLMDKLGSLSPDKTEKTAPAAAPSVATW